MGLQSLLSLDRYETGRKSVQICFPHFQENNLLLWAPDARWDSPRLSVARYKNLYAIRNDCFESYCH